MNKARRKMIANAVDTLENLISLVQEIHDEEEEALDNMPESLEGTDRYDMMEEAVDNLDESLSSLEDALDYLQSAME